MNNSPNLVRIRRIAAGLFVVATAAVGGLAAQLAADADATHAAPSLDRMPAPAADLAPRSTVDAALTPPAPAPAPAVAAVPPQTGGPVPAPPVDTAKDVPAQAESPSEEAPAATPYLSNRTSRDRDEAFDESDIPQWTTTPAPTTTQAPPHAHTEAS
ncbi:hypothetical protein ACWDUL_37640 [Nocardia niigatensis]|uniref:hypothetical protein n=1 Tax=Nocardia niigatensis TaxID=209249 RepID=UPI0002E692E6|nr:hypothetical protein [Nocardia niigatensis]